MPRPFIQAEKTLRARIMPPTDLRTAIERLGYSQKELAEAFGVHPVTVRKWVTGAQPIPPWVPKFIALLEQTSRTP